MNAERRAKHTEYCRKWRAAHLESVKESQRKWHSANPGYNRKRRAANPEKLKADNDLYHASHPEGERARNAINGGVRRGHIFRPDSCSACGKVGRLQGHHPDYTKPLDVVWLCSPCHSREHESSGDKVSVPGEKQARPISKEAASLMDTTAGGRATADLVPAHSPAPTIKKDLTVGVEEAMKWIEGAVKLAADHSSEGEIMGTQAALDVIKSALRLQK